MRATYLSFALAATLALASGGSAMAQRFGHGGVHVGGGHVAVHVGGFHAGYGNYGRANYYAYGRHYGYARPFWGGVFWGSPYYYESPGYYYSAPAYASDLPPVAYTSPAAAEPVTLTVVVPDANAQVFLNDTATTATGAERVFQSPPVEQGKSYQYTVKAEWMENGKMVEHERVVPVTAGQSVTVDFRTPAQEIIAPPEIR